MEKNKKELIESQNDKINNVSSCSKVIYENKIF